MVSGVNAAGAGPLPSHAGAASAAAQVITSVAKVLSILANPVNQVTLRVLESLDELRAAAPAWRELLARAAGNVFLTPEWIIAWFEALEGAARPAVVVVEEQGRWLGMLPLARAVQRMGPAAFRVADFAGAQITTSDHLGLVAEAADHDLMWRTILPWLESEARTTHVLRFSGMDEGPTAAAVSALGKTRGWSVRGPIRDVAPALALPATYEAFEQTLSGQRRQHLRRYWRRLQRHTEPIRIGLNGSIRPLDVVLTDLTRLHTSLWQSRGLPGTLGDPAMGRFLARFSVEAERQGWLRVHQLYVGERMAAAAVVLHWGQTASYYQSGWDVTMAELQVADLLLAHSIRRAIDEGMRRYDFLRGAEAYKSRFGAVPVPQVMYEVAAQPLGKLFLLTRGARARVGGVLRAIGLRRPA